MTIVLLIAIGLAIAWWLNGRRAASFNEKLYLRRRGYQPEEPPEVTTQVSRDAHLFNLIESLTDLSPYARERAAEELSRLCASGRRDKRMLSPLISALDDNDPSVRRAVAMALGTFGGEEAAGSLNRRLEKEESVPVRSALKKAMENL